MVVIIDQLEPTLGKGDFICLIKDKVDISKTNGATSPIHKTNSHVTLKKKKLQDLEVAHYFYPLLLFSLVVP